MCASIQTKPSDAELRTIFETKVYPSLLPILTSYGITHLMHRLHYRYPKYDESAGIETLVITSSDEDTTFWRQAAKAILNLFWEHGAERVVGNVQVEIENREKCYSDVSVPLPNDELILNSLASIRLDVLDIVKSRLHGIWTSIAYHLRESRFSSEPGKPTLLVFCAPGSSSNFDVVERQIMEVLRNVPFDVYLEILPGAVMPLKAGKPVVLEDISAKPRNGDSISIEGRTNEAGSLGGWLTLNLRQPFRRPKCALTCYHVVRSDNKNVTQHTDTNGVRLNDGRGQVSVEYPAAYDAMFSKERFEKRLPGKIAAEQLEILSSRLARPAIGKVILASGYRTNEKNQRVEWAIIESPKTFQANKPPPRSAFGQSSFTLPMDQDYCQDEDSKVRAISSFKVGDWVTKCGRTTAVTSGHVNGMCRDINWLRLGFTSSEWEIISQDGEFADQGDSGSIVTNARGELIGLLFAVDSRPKEFGAAFFTPFDTIQDDVKRLTGGGFLSLD